MRIALFIALVAVAACKSERKAAPPAPAASTPAAASAAPKPAGSVAKSNRLIPTLPPSEQTVQGWTAAADGFARDLAACTKDCADTAYAVLIARKNAIAAAPLPAPPDGDGPAPVPPTITAFVDSVDKYAALADPGDPELPSLRFTAASSLYRYRQPDAIERLELILRTHRTDEVAEYAANQLLDLLMRSDRQDELRTWVTELLGDAAFVAAHPALRDTLQRLQEMLQAAR